MSRFAWIRPNRLRRGDFVEVRSEAEIAATLDAEGCLDGLPFMPEMSAYCGSRARIHRRASKTCVEGLGLRRMSDTLFLEGLRCDGGAHDGCDRGCLMFWKEAWLKPVAMADGATDGVRPMGLTPLPDPLTEYRQPPIRAATRTLPLDLPTRQGERYVCQSTALAVATSPMAGWNPIHLVRDMSDGELTIGQFFRIMVRGLVNKLRGLVRRREIGGLAGDRKRNPKGDLGLSPGETIAVRTPAEIAATLDPTGRNQGLSFEPDMAEYTCGVFEVEKPVRRIILEQTGKMAHLTHTVVLKGVTCQGLCSKNCPRANPLFWREIWLRRADAPATAAPSKPAGQSRLVTENANT